MWSDYIHVTAILVLISSIIIFILSSYGIGKTIGDKTSAEYQSSTTFLIISSITTLVSLVAVLFTINKDLIGLIVG